MNALIANISDFSEINMRRLNSVIQKMISSMAEYNRDGAGIGLAMDEG